MPLSSISTTAEIRAAYDDNASYDMDASVDKAKAFVAACRMLIRRTPTASAQGGESIALSVDSLQKELASALQWLSINDPNQTSTPKGQVVHADLRNSR